MTTRSKHSVWKGRWHILFCWEFNLMILCLLFVHSPQIEVVFLLNVNVFPNIQSKGEISFRKVWIIIIKSPEMLTLKININKTAQKAYYESRHESALRKLMCHPLRCGNSGLWCENTGCRYWDRKWHASKFQSLMSMSVFKVMRNFWHEYTSELWLALRMWYEKHKQTHVTMIFTFQYEVVLYLICLKRTVIFPISIDLMTSDRE